MNRLLIFWVALVAVSARGLAQASAEADGDPLATGPLVVTRMPDHSQWTVDYVYSDALKPGTESPTLKQYREMAKDDPALAKQMANPGFLAMLSPSRPLQVAVTKTGPIFHILELLEQNQTSETWGNANVLAERRPSNPKLIVTFADNSGRVDFPEFFWIKKDNYTGIEVENGQKCLSFKAQVDPVQLHYQNISGDTTVEAVAHVDLKTRRPVSLQFGVETRKYVYADPPSSDLELPSDVTAASRATMARLQKLTPTPSNR